MLIGLTGAAGAGKDTVANILIKEFDQVNKPVAQIAFADTLKEMMCVLLSCTREKLEDRLFKESPHPILGGKTPRYAMQTIGTEWGRNMIDSEIWTNATKAKINELIELGIFSAVVTTDVRFDNEARLIQELGGVVIGIERPNNPLAIGSQHASECGVSKDLIDEFFLNDAEGIDALKEKVVDFFGNLNYENYVLKADF
jgi:hypothetical protein